MQSDAFHRTFDIINVKLFEIGGHDLSVATLITAIAIVIAAYLVSRLVQSAIVRTLGPKNDSVHVATRISHYLIVVVGFSIALQTAGIDLRGLFAAGALFAVGIGFAMQNVAQNFVSGVILLVEHSIRPDDVLEIEGKQVRVIEMGIRSTRVRSRDDEVLIVPNSTLVQSTVRSYTLLDSLCRVRVNVGVAYSSDMRVVRSTLEAAAASVTVRSQSRAPLVLLESFGESSVNWEVSIWIEDPWMLRPTGSVVREAIWNALQEKNIGIPYRQIDLHLDEPVLRALGARSAA
ncbi:MAG TPA: mechanosensitive ion channel domain-containing protein [Polyangiaceae bacterium]|jgi:small-conductance mechanosensitive channel|nr:mechanosensitive ion channel domain-containing protein [Polyangiaceae bacterium]